MKIKTWMFNKISAEAKCRNCFIDVYNRKDDGSIDFDAEFQEVHAEIIRETEKAVYADLSTGLIDGSVFGWKCWIPKSCITL